MKMVPLHDNIWVEKDKPSEKKSPAGIILTEKAQTKPDTGVVVAVGPGRVMQDGSIVKPPVMPGDRIVFKRFGGNDLTWDDEEHFVLSFSDVVGILKED